MSGNLSSLIIRHSVHNLKQHWLSPTTFNMCITFSLNFKLSSTLVTICPQHSKEWSCYCGIIVRHYVTATDSVRQTTGACIKPEIILAGVSIRQRSSAWLSINTNCLSRTIEWHIVDAEIAIQIKWASFVVSWRVECYRLTEWPINNKLVFFYLFGPSLH